MFSMCSSQIWFVISDVTCFQRYADIISKAQDRHKKLDESIKQHGMLREAKEVESWIQDVVSSCIQTISILRTLLRILMGNNTQNSNVDRIVYFQY